MGRILDVEELSEKLVKVYSFRFAELNLDEDPMMKLAASWPRIWTAQPI